MNKKKKKRFTLKKVKKIINNFFVEVKEFIGKIPAKVKIVIVIWLVIFLLLLFMIFASNANKKFLNEYYNIESKMNDSALKYVTQKEIYPTNSKPLKLSLDTLIDFKYLDSQLLDNKVCQGYSVIYYNDVDKDYVVNSYLNCTKYTSDGYNENK